MSYPFDAAFRDEITHRCAEFPRVAYDGPELKRSAVAITLVDAGDGSGETAFLLTRRAPKLRAHAGQWALPGGRLDAGETAVVDILGPLDDYPTRSGYAITPVVAWLDDTAALAPNPDEVASVHRIRLDHISGEDAVRFIAIPESDRPVIQLRIGDGFVHAPTAAMVYQLRELAAGRITRVDQLEQPVFAWR
jgi:hypothetical protein